MNVNIGISRYFINCVFLTMGSSDCKGLLQLYLELVDAYKRREINDKGACALHFMEILSAFCLYHATLIQVLIETFRYPFI